MPANTIAGGLSMLPTTGECLDRMEAAIARLAVEAAEGILFAFEMLREPTSSGPNEDPGTVAITTRGGVRVVVDDEKIYIRGRSTFVRAEWREVPAFIACLRGALVPEYKKTVVDPALAEVGLLMASHFGHKAGEEPGEVLFTADDAADITRDYTLATLCPDEQIASEIKHVQRIGPRKLFNYIETEIRWE